MRRRSPQATIYSIALVLAASLLALRAWRWFFGELGLLSDKAAPDLRLYIDAVQALLHGRNPYLSSPGAGTAQVVGNTPLILLALSPLTLVSWTAAKTIGLVINVGSALAIALLLEERLLPAPSSVSRLVLIATIFLAFAPTSSAIQVGQAPLVIVLSALAGVLLLPGSPLLAGLSLGFALSKYSLTFLLVPYLVCERRYRALAVALLTQVAGVAVAAWLLSSSPAQMIRDYSAEISVLLYHPTEYRLYSRLVEAGLSPATCRIIDVAGILVSIGVTVRYLLSPRLRSAATDRSVLVPFLLIASIPFVYHRLYDGVVFILLASTLAWAWNERARSVEDRRYANAVAAVSALVLAVLLYPRALPTDWRVLKLIGGNAEVVVALLTWALLVARLSWRGVPAPAVGTTIPSERREASLPSAGAASSR